MTSASFNNWSTLDDKTWISNLFRLKQQQELSKAAHRFPFEGTASAPDGHAPLTTKYPQLPVVMRYPLQRLRLAGHHGGAPSRCRNRRRHAPPVQVQFQVRRSAH